MYSASFNNCLMLFNCNFVGSGKSRLSFLVVVFSYRKVLKSFARNLSGELKEVVCCMLHKGNMLLWHRMMVSGDGIQLKRAI